MPYYDNNYDDSSLNTEDRLLEARKQLQRADKNFHRLKRTKLDERTTLKNDDGKTYYMKVNVDVYGNGQVGTRIRNAVTGIRYPYVVGSKDQDLLYSVAICTGENGLKEAIHLFYDSPEQYENHMFQNVNMDIKTNWYNNYNTYMKATC
jgi:hypothetical protein